MTVSTGNMLIVTYVSYVDVGPSTFWLPAFNSINVSFWVCSCTDGSDSSTNWVLCFFLLSLLLFFSLSADEYRVFLEQREEKLKADAEAAAAAAAEALMSKKKWRPPTSNTDPSPIPVYTDFIHVPELLMLCVRS